MNRAELKRGKCGSHADYVNVAESAYGSGDSGWPAYSRMP